MLVLFSSVTDIISLSLRQRALPSAKMPPRFELSIGIFNSFDIAYEPFSESSK